MFFLYYIIGPWIILVKQNDAIRWSFDDKCHQRPISPQLDAEAPLDTHYTPCSQILGKMNKFASSHLIVYWRLQI